MIGDRTIDAELAMRRAQVYGFLSSAMLYPTENWTLDLESAVDALQVLGYADAELSLKPMDLSELRSEYLRAIGVSGPLSYETEYGLQNAYRQSHELADISGFYRAFGFGMGGTVRERPDHLAAELEFMHVLTLKEWRACLAGDSDAREICMQAQRNFLQDHLGRWIEAFAMRVAFEARDSLYADLARFAVAFVKEDSKKVGAEPEPLTPERLRPTPNETRLDCGNCCLADGTGGS